MTMTMMMMMMMMSTTLPPLLPAPLEDCPLTSPANQDLISVTREYDQRGDPTRGDTINVKSPFGNLQSRLWWWSWRWWAIDGGSGIKWWSWHRSWIMAMMLTASMMMTMIIVFTSLTSTIPCLAPRILKCFKPSGSVLCSGRGFVQSILQDSNLACCELAA